MDTLDDKFGRPDNIIASPELSRHVNTFGNWGSFLAILHFVGIGLTYIVGFAFIAGMSFFGNAYEAGYGVGFGMVYIVIATLLLLPTIKFYRSCRLAIQVARNPSADNATEAIRNLASAVKIYGIYTLVYLGILILTLFSGFLFGAMI